MQLWFLHKIFAKLTTPPPIFRVMSHLNSLPRDSQLLIPPWFVKEADTIGTDTSKWKGSVQIDVLVHNNSVKWHQSIPDFTNSPSSLKRKRCQCELWGLESECLEQQTVWLRWFLWNHLHRNTHDKSWMTVWLAEGSQQFLPSCKKASRPFCQFLGRHGDGSPSGLFGGVLKPSNTISSLTYCI